MSVIDARHRFRRTGPTLAKCAPARYPEPKATGMHVHRFRPAAPEAFLVEYASASRTVEFVVTRDELTEFVIEALSLLGRRSE